MRYDECLLPFANASPSVARTFSVVAGVGQRSLSKGTKCDKADTGGVFGGLLCSVSSPDSLGSSSARNSFDASRDSISSSRTGQKGPLNSLCWAYANAGLFMSRANMSGLQFKKL